LVWAEAERVAASRKARSERMQEMIVVFEYEK